MVVFLFTTKKGSSQQKDIFLFANPLRKRALFFLGGEGGTKGKPRKVKGGVKRVTSYDTKGIPASGKVGGDACITEWEP